MIKKRLKNKANFLCFFILVFIGINHINARSGKGRVSGLVVDESGTPIVNAYVQIIWKEEGEHPVIHKTQTDKNGKFRFKHLGNGPWEIWVMAKGYVRTYKRIHIRQMSKGPEVRIILEKYTKARLKELLNGSGSLLEQGHQLYDVGKYDEARALYTKFLKQHPGFFYVHIFIGDCYKAKGALEQAMAEYRHILDITGLDPTVETNLYTAVGDLYLRRDNVKIAVTYFDQALQRNPSPQLAYQIGEVFLGLNRAEESIRYFRRAAALKTGWADPYLKLGYIYLNAGDPQSAVVHFEKFLELSSNPDHKAAIKVLIKKLSKILD